MDIVWFRRDLRLADNPALKEALAGGAAVIPCYIHSPDEEAPWSPGAASRWWLHEALESLDTDLRALGSRLIVRAGPTGTALNQLLRETGAQTVYWNRLYEPAMTARDQRLKASLKERGIEARSFNAALLAEPWTVATKGGTPFRVFTPFWNAVARRLDEAPAPSPRPTTLPAVPPHVSSLTIAALGLRPRRNWVEGLAAVWRPSEAGARRQLEQSVKTRVAKYRTTRDRPARPARRGFRRICTSVNSVRDKSFTSCAPRSVGAHSPPQPPMPSCARSGGVSSLIICCFTFRTRRKLPSRRPLKTCRPGRTRRSSPAGSKARRGYRSSTPECGSCGRPGGCTTACA